MPIIELKSRGVELDFPDSMSDQEIQDAINKEYPRDGKDVAYELEQFRNAALTGGDLSNPFDQMSDDDYIKLRQYQDKEKKSWSDLFGISKDTFSTIYDDVIQGAGSSIYNAATGKAGQVAESAKQGMIAGTIGISDLATKIIDPSKPIPTKEDFLKQTKDQPLETMADEAAPFFRKQVKNTEEDYLALVKNEKRKDSESFNRILAMESTLRGAPIEDVAAAFQYVDPTLIAGVASAGLKTLAKTLLKKGAQETAQASVEAAAREAAQRAAQQSAETIEGGGMREVVLNQAENLAQGVQSAASLPSKVMQAVKEGAEAIAPGTGAPAQAAAMTAAAMTDLGITASVLAGTKTIEKAAEVAGSMARAAKQGASRAGLLERAALDPKISGSARAFANGLAQIQPLFGVGIRTAKQAAKGALAGAGVGAGLGYLADGEEGAAAGFGAGAAFGSMFGTLGSLWDVSKEAIGGSTARTRQNAAGDIGRFIAEKLPQEQAGWTSVFNNLAAKAGLEKAAHSMDALKIAEAAGAEVRLATPDEIAKWNSPGWANHNEISGKQELVLNPERILSDTAPHETAHIYFNAATNNLFKPEMFKAIVGSVDPVDGKVISEGLFTNEGLARIADDIAKSYEGLEKKTVKTKDGEPAPEPQSEIFKNYAEQLRNSLDPDNLSKARDAIVDELTATYVGKAFNRSKAGRFNPDRLPLLYRRALDSIHEGFFNKLRATIYEKGNVLNMRDISKAFIDDKGRPIRIPELDAIFKKAFTNKLKAVDENTAPVDRIPVNLNDRAIWARSYGNMSGVLNPDNTVKSAAQIDREAAQRWQDMTARLSALPENQRLGLSFGRDDNGKTTMTAKGQISEEAINAILASDSIDQTAKSFLREVFTSIKDPQKTTLDTRYYGVYTRGKGTSKMVAGVKPASQNEILPYSIEFNSKDGIIVRAVDMTKVRDRLADALRKPDFKDAYKDYNQAMRGFRTYLDNLTLDKPVESSIILGGGELGNKRRNLFYDALDFRPAQGDKIRNNPLKLATGKSNPIKSYRIERFTRLSPTRDKFSFEEGTTFTRVKSNYQPDSFTPETLPNGEAWTNPDGYRILKNAGSKLYKVYDKDGAEIGVAFSQDAAIKKAQSDAAKKMPKEEPTSTKRFQPSQLTARNINDIANEVGGGEVKGGAKKFGAFMRSMRDKGITLRDVVKSYGITLSSIQRQELSVDTVRKNWPDAPFESGTKVRPEDAFAALLGTPEGQRYLDSAQQGIFDEPAVDAMMQKFKTFGFQNKLKDQLKVAAEEFFPKASSIIDAVNNMPPEQFAEFVRSNVRGISYGKIGFWSGQLGRGDIPTFDSRMGKLVYGKEVPVSKKVLMEQKDRLTQLGINVPNEYQDFAQTLLHHEVWDRLNQSDTEHAPIKEAMLRFQPDAASPSILNGTNGTRIIKSTSGKFRVYSGTGALLGIRDTQQAAEKLASKP